MYEPLLLFLVNGRMSISNTVFAYFNNVCNRSDVAIQVSQSYDDGQFPIKTSRIYTHMVSSSNIMFNGKPNLDKVNPSDCGGKVLITYSMITESVGFSTRYGL